MNIRFFRNIACGLALAAAGTAHASWPDHTITVVAPWAAGGNADIHARLFAKVMSEKLGQPVVVENRSGAGGMVGALYVSHAKPDGYTFLLGAFANMLGEFFHREKTLSVERDLAPVAQLTNIPNYIAVSPKSKYSSFKQLLDEAKADPKQVTCATPGVGTAAHLVCAIINKDAGTHIETIPYRGGVPAIMDVISGRVTFYAGNESLPYIQDGRLKGLAITSLKRSTLAPDLPPVSDVLSGYNVNSWYGMFAPKGTPKEVLERVSSIVDQAMKDPKIRDQLAKLGAVPVGSTPDQFKKFIKSENQRWAPIAKSLDIHLD
ncbi:Bug family tripartite tricarboxylate transporter substrate binding protein [Candidimonas nitroreducens]|uniref:ABC transporter substrate-binding protein n=1 Tax=Candidimonas nitroreducens TaxID=683354 RepID=A0A225M817_9BURK|nr:tripartite tricarboxylate transporter substrate binding protein [Candidimonas nitroreducens]OWT56872.1 hypothetical protein CEY11_18520 [Candidimonas nitroreducens]